MYTHHGRVRLDYEIGGRSLRTIAMDNRGARHSGHDLPLTPR